MKAVVGNALTDPRGLVHRPELDGLRALAVVAVVVYHAYAPIAYGNAQTPLEAVGARGVDLFFVLSGFCLSLPYGRDSMRTVADATTFLRRRFTRIAPPYYAALALFAILAFTPFGIPGIATQATVAFQKEELVRDLFFFPTLTPIHDQPIWTLGIEMRWYLLFGPILLLFHRFKIGFAALAAACWWLAHAIGSPDCASLPTFMLGIVAAELAKAKPSINKIWPLVAPVALALAINEQLHTLKIDHGSVLWAVACFSIVMAVVTNASLRRVFSCRPFVAIGVSSYSIYLMHLPFFNALVWTGVPAWFAAFAAIVIGFAFYGVVELPLGKRNVRSAMDAAIVRIWNTLTLEKLRSRVAV